MALRTRRLGGALLAAQGDPGVHVGGETKTYVLEEAIVTDFALVHAWKGDRHGNLVYRESARNFNPLCAMAGRVTIAEVENLVEIGEIRPEDVHTPGVFVQRVVDVGPTSRSGSSDGPCDRDHEGGGR